jgi:hypothetical protein
MIGNFNIAIKQLISCFKARYEIDVEGITSLEHALQNEPFKSRILEWYQKFYHDVFISRNGYPQFEVSHTPYTENFIQTLVTDLQLPYRIQHKPVVCLSHDIDNLSGSLPLSIKSLVSEKVFRRFDKDYEFITSIKDLLALDQSYAGRNGASTIFVAMPYKSSNMWIRLKQFIIDPTYDDTHPLFNELVKLLKQFNCCIGVHGSFFSITEKFLEHEVNKLSHAVGQEILYSRQHWLNLPNQDALNYIKQTGVLMDSSLGWNGNCGFRGGMARPFQLIFEDQSSLWTLPMILMDGPLLHDMKLNRTEILAFTKRMLQAVVNVGGCISINWHDRAAHEDYLWSEVYIEVLKQLKAFKFKFSNIEEIYELYAKRP